MLEAGVNVCLGTDSIVCHGTLGVIDEMRRLHARDAADPATLLAMGTSNGARALGYDGDAATFEAGPAAGAGVVALRFDPDEAEDAWTQVLRQRSAVEAEILEEPT
jgi:cytosine/adenosine deaminase-related metal-dependent hydrolase